MKKSLWFIPLAAVAGLTPAGVAQAGEVYFGAGTTGIVLGVGEHVGAHTGVRAEANALSYSRSVSTTNVDYDGKLKADGVNLMIDCFPVADVPFRVTVGAVFGNNRLTAVGKPRNNTFTINGQTFSAAGESINFTVKQPSVQPYLGIGLGHLKNKGWAFFADLGATYGKPKVDFTATPGLVAAATQANIDAERQDVQSKANDYKFYPVIKLGVSYAF